MNALALKKGASRHSAYDLRGPLDQHEETHTLAVLGRQRGRACWRGSSASSPAAATTSRA